MIWIIIIGIVAFILFRFYNSLNNDNYDLLNQSVSKKFSVIVNMIHDEAFNGLGEITILDKRVFNLYQDGQNQIINFNYSTGHLTITWKYKYFQKEILHSKTFKHVRNLSLFEQEKIGRIMIDEMNRVVEQHKNNVMNM